MPRDAVKSTSSPIDARRLATQGKRCKGKTKRGTPCRRWAIIGRDYCHWHSADDKRPEPKSDFKAEPSSLPGMTLNDVHDNERQIAAKIKRKKAAEVRTELKKKKKQQATAERAAKDLVGAVDKQLVAAGNTALIPIGDTNLRTLENCLMLIEYAVDEILDLAPSLTKSKTLIQAARTAGQLIIQAGVADKAVQWFQDNVKLVANIDLDQI